MADDCALAGYFSRLLGILLSRSADQILGFLKASSQTLSFVLEVVRHGSLQHSKLYLCAIAENDRMAQA